MIDTLEAPEQKTLTLGLSGYRIKGVADVTMWGGGNACIEMKPIKIRTLDRDDLMKHVNDNGFGVQSINGAILDLFEDYEGTLQYMETIQVGEISEHTQEYYNEHY
jgi:hypothetical protein